MAVGINGEVYCTTSEVGEEVGISRFPLLRLFFGARPLLA